MARELDRSENKIQAISDLLRKETLEPAQSEANQIIEKAKADGEEIITQAKRKAEEVIQAAHRKVEQERQVFYSALEQASKQAFTALKQQIEKDLFDTQFSSWVSEQTSNPDLVAKLIESIVEAIRKQGIDTEITALIPKTLKPEQVNAVIGKRILDQLKDKSVQLGRFSGGAQVRLHDEKMTLDISGEVLKDAMAKYVRQDFRELIFIN